MKKSPSSTDLRIFALLQALFWGWIGWGLLHRGWPALMVYAGWALAGFAGAVGTLRPDTARSYYMGWMKLVAPLGWLVYHVLIAIVYFGVVTPIGWWRRKFLGDPLQRGFDREAASYWQPRPGPRDARSYFRRS